MTSGDYLRTSDGPQADDGLTVDELVRIDSKEGRVTMVADAIRMLQRRATLEEYSEEALAEFKARVDALADALPLDERQEAYRQANPETYGEAPATAQDTTAAAGSIAQILRGRVREVVEEGELEVGEDVLLPRSIRTVDPIGGYGFEDY